MVPLRRWSEIQGDPNGFWFLTVVVSIQDPRHNFVLILKDAGNANYAHFIGLRGIDPRGWQMGPDLAGDICEFT